MIAFCWFYQVNLSIRVYLLIFFKSQYLLFYRTIIFIFTEIFKSQYLFYSKQIFSFFFFFFFFFKSIFVFFKKLKLVLAQENVRSRTSPQFLLRARRNEKEMKVKPATSFKLLTIFIPQKKIRQDSKQNNVSKQYLSSLCHKVPLK